MPVHAAKPGLISGQDELPGELFLYFGGSPKVHDCTGDGQSSAAQTDYAARIGIFDKYNPYELSRRKIELRQEAWLLARSHARTRSDYHSAL
jgi:hypothetical protein